MFANPGAPGWRPKAEIIKLTCSGWSAKTPGPKVPSQKTPVQLMLQEPTKRSAKPTSWLRRPLGSEANLLSYQEMSPNQGPLSFATAP